MKKDNVVSVKTYRDDYYEKYPDADHDECGDPIPCVKHVYGESHAYTENDVCECMQPLSVCHNCWNRPMQEEAAK